MKICWGEFIKNNTDSLLGVFVYSFVVGFVQSVSTVSTMSFFNSFQSRKGLDVDIVTANASKESDKLQILNSIALPRAATKQLQMDAAVSHERDSEMKTWAM